MRLYRLHSRTRWKERKTDESMLKELRTIRELLSKIKRRKLPLWTCLSQQMHAFERNNTGKMEGLRRGGRPGKTIDSIKLWTRGSSKRIYSSRDQEKIGEKRYKGRSGHQTSRKTTLERKSVSCRRKNKGPRYTEALLV